MPIGVSEHNIRVRKYTLACTGFSPLSQKGQAELCSRRAKQVSAEVRKMENAWIFHCLMENTRYIGRQARGSNLLTDKHAQMERGNHRPGHKIDFSVMVCNWVSGKDHPPREWRTTHVDMAQAIWMVQIFKPDNLGNYMTGIVKPAFLLHISQSTVFLIL